MSRLILTAPTEDYKEQILAYKAEFQAHGDSLDGTAGLAQAHSFADWYAAVLDNSNEKTLRPERVPAATFLALRISDGRMVGMIDIRLRLNDFLLQFGGNIGYSIRRSERRNGYATEMLSLALDTCRKRNMEKVLITCNKENIGSAKTILNNGGVLENEVPDENEITQRYWITL